MHFQIPLYIKIQNQSYSEYLLSLTQYICNFYKKTNPLKDFNEIEIDFHETFDEEW